MPTQDLPDFDALWDYRKPAETEMRFRAILPQAEASADRGYHLELLTQIARTMSLRRQFDAAHALLDQIESKLTPDLKQAKVRYLLERGRTHNSADETDKARPLFHEAMTLAQEIGADGYAVDAAHMIAIVAAGEDALNWNLEAIKAAEASTQPPARKWLGSLYNNLGWSYHDLDRFADALAMFQKGEVWQAEHGKPGTHRIARWCVARTLRSLGRYEEALAIQEALLKDYEAIDEEPGFTYEELGECLFALDRKSEAQPYFAKAHAILSADGFLAMNQPDRIARLRRLAAVDA